MSLFDRLVFDPAIFDADEPASDSPPASRVMFDQESSFALDRSTLRGQVGFGEPGQLSGDYS